MAAQVPFSSCWLFQGYDFGVSSDILFCGALFAISGAEIFGFLSYSVLYGRLLWIQGAKNFSVALFLVVSGRLVSGPVFLSISGISIFAFLSGIILNGTCQAKPALGDILRSLDAWFFGLLVVCAAVVLRYLVRRIFVLCPESIVMGRVKEDLLPENFAVIRCLAFCLCVVCAAVVLRYLVVRFLSWFWSCSLLLSVRFGSLSRAFPLRLSFFLFFSLLRVSLLLGGRPGRGPLSLHRFSSWPAEVTMPPLQAGVGT